MYNSSTNNLALRHHHTITIYLLFITFIQPTYPVHGHSAWFEADKAEIILTSSEETSGSDVTNNGYAPLSIAARSPIECVLKCRAKSLTPFYTDNVIRHTQLAGVDEVKCFCLKKSTDKQINSGEEQSNIFPIKGNTFAELSQVSCIFPIFHIIRRFKIIGLRTLICRFLM